MNLTLLMMGGAALAAVATLLVLRPLLKARSDRFNGKSFWILLVLFPVVVLLVYSQLTSYPWGGEVPAAPLPGAAQPTLADVEQMVDGLAARLQEQPDDLQGWEMLGRSYMELKRYPEALNAWREAWRLSEGSNVEIAVNFAEAQVMADPKTLLGQAGDILDAVLADHPDNPKALWYGGMSSAARGDTAAAEVRWSRLLQDPELPDNIRQLVQQQLAAMGADMQAAAPGGPMIRLSIELDAQFIDLIRPGQKLFVFARDASSGGPPVAVKRLDVNKFPLNTTLSDADVMMPGLKLSNVKNLRIVARISTSGDAMESSGDMFGEAFPEPLGNETMKLNLRINQLVP